ncbi:hypothetical protein BX266_4823 [Streptomyces sp. TLI_171]|nr:hypothetical protein BX266_4823 [Streptomyces sp. TLI_171]
MGCRKRAAKHELLRVVAGEDAYVPDPRGTLPGRGAYLHPVPTCLDLAVRRRAFLRALRVPGALDPGALREHVEAGAPPADGRERDGVPPTR